MNKFLLTVCAFALGLLAIAPCAAQAQSVAIGAPVVACDSPTGVGCDGKTILRPGKYTLTRVVPYTGICHVSGAGGSGYTRCSAFATKPRGQW
jgi:hypothetical protein